MQSASHPHCPSHADIRTSEILGSVRNAFVDKGFDGASMQDLARAAGMSVGNFYRYFASKSAIIQALILHDAAEMRRDFDEIIKTPDPIAALRLAIHDRVTSSACAKDVNLWAEIEAASRRSPDIAGASRQMEAEVVGRLLAVFAAGTGVTEDEAKRLYSASAAYILVMVKAASWLSCVASLDQEQVRAMITRNIDQTLATIAATSPSARNAQNPLPPQTSTI